MPGRVDPVTLWTLAQDWADTLGSPVDLVDLRFASTVLQYQVITTGERWWDRDSRADIYEAAMLSEKPPSTKPDGISFERGEFMADDVVINKAAIIERAAARAREEYYRDPASFSKDFTPPGRRHPQH